MTHPAEEVERRLALLVAVVRAGVCRGVGRAVLERPIGGAVSMGGRCAGHDGGVKGQISNDTASRACNLSR
jgi:hypothetical protein